METISRSKIYSDSNETYLSKIYNNLNFFRWLRLERPRFSINSDDELISDNKKFMSSISDKELSKNSTAMMGVISGHPIETAITIEDMLTKRSGWSGAGLKVAFVPTMGALHAGHIALVEQARKFADKVVVSIFVNPTQFGPNEDFSKYPRTLQKDLELLQNKADLVFLPTAAGMYPDGFQTYLINKKMALGLCGATRVNHFEGVLTIVLKLFNIVQPNIALFGKKDYQQWRLIETMVRDLNLSIKVFGLDTVREEDGLAMSSRNRYLDSAHREAAVEISKGLFEVRRKFTSGEKNPEALKAIFQKTLMSPLIKMEYLEICRQIDLSPILEKVDQPGVILVAARLGTTRLIDNIELS